MSRAGLRSIVAATLLLLIAPHLRAQQEPASSPRRRAPLTILQINDVYSTSRWTASAGSRASPRSRSNSTRRPHAAADDRRRLPVLVGRSTVFKGEQMIAALNAAGLDVATLGNHEFDFGVDLLLTRMRQAKWQWVDLKRHRPPAPASHRRRRCPVRDPHRSGP